MEGIYILCGVGGLFLIGSTCIILDMIYNVEQEVFIRIKKPESIDLNEIKLFIVAIARAPSMRKADLK